MPKPNYNNKVSHPNIYGRVIQHDLWLNQGVRSGDSPTFGGLQITGDTTLEGNLYVLGNTTILDTNITEFEDNILLINRAETGPGVSLNQSGLEIERGTLENYRFIFDEPTDTFRIGVVSTTQAVATRQDSPLYSGVMIWNQTENRLDSRDYIDISIRFNSTTDSTHSTNGSVVLAGGLGVSKNVTINNILILEGSTGNTSITTQTTSDSLHITTPKDVIYSMTGNTIFPYNSKISLGNTTQSISSDTTGNITLATPKNLTLALSSTSNIFIPQYAKLNFATTSEYIKSDSLGMHINSVNDVNITPSTGNKVLIPEDTPLAFGSATRQISGGQNGDVTILAANHIHLIPASNMDVTIPADSSLKLGGSGNQTITADATDNLTITSSADLRLSPESGSKILVPTTIPLAFANASENIKSTTIGNLSVSAATEIVLNSPSTRITSTSPSALVVSGGIQIQKLYINSNVLDAVSIINSTSTNELLRISNNSVGAVTVLTGDGTITKPTVELSSQSATSAKSLIQLKGAFDLSNKYNIGRGTSTLNSGRSMTVNLASYTDYSNTGDTPKFQVMTNDHSTNLLSIDSTGITTIHSTITSVNETHASLVISGGLSVQKNTRLYGELTQVSNSTQAILVQGSVRLDTISNTLFLPAKLESSGLSTFLNTTESVDSTNASLMVSGGASIQKKLRVTGSAHFSNTVDMTNNPIINLASPVNDFDAATKEYVDLMVQGISVKDSVTVATTVPLTLATDFIVGSTIDSFVVALGDRILIKDQTNAIQNGIYVVSGTAGSPLRADDLLTGSEASGVFVFVQEGAINKSLGWICNSPTASDVTGTDTLSFTQFTGLGHVEAGAALTKNFNQLNVSVDNSSIEIVSDALRIKNTIAGTGLTGGSGTVLQTLSDQSHVTKVGILDTGTWQANTIQVLYGGTGRTVFTSGNILFGNGTGALATDSKLFFNSTAGNLGIGTNLPTSELHIIQDNEAEITIHADNSESNSTAYPSLVLRHGSTVQGSVKITRNYSDFATGTYPDSLLISNSKSVQISTDNMTRLTVTTTGNVGINTTNPNSMLTVNGTLTTNGVNTILDTTESSSVTSGSLVISGGAGISKSANILGTVSVHSTTTSTNSSTAALMISGGASIASTTNAASVTQGGSLTAAGGAAITKDLYVGGNVYSSSTIISSTQDSLNSTTGALTISGGASIASTTNATSVTQGGSLTAAGGAAIAKDLMIGGSAFIQSDLDFQNTNGNVMISLTSDKPTGDLSINTHNILTGALTKQVVAINNTTGNVSLNTNTAITSTTNATNASTGSLTVAGGVGIVKDFYVQGVSVLTNTSTSNLNSNNVTVNENLVHSSNGLFTNITNTNTASSLWVYLGQTSDCELVLSGLHFKASVTDTNLSAYHSSTNRISPSTTIVNVYKDPANDYHVFVKESPGNSNNLQVIESSNIFTPALEGTSTTPNGTTSGFTTGWLLSYTTDSESTMYESTGRFTVEQAFKTADNIPIIGYNNSETTSSRNVGLLYELYYPDVVAGTPDFSDTLPSQSTLTAYQIKFSNAASSVNGTYIGYLVSVTSGVSSPQIRRISGYLGATRLATLETPWDTQNPEEDDTIELFNKTHASLYYNTTSGSFNLSMVSVNGSDSLVDRGLADISMNVATIGNMVSQSINVNSTQDSLVSSSESGSIITDGGIFSHKHILSKLGVGIGENINNETTLLSLHHPQSTVKLSNTTGSYSYIDFSEDNTSNRFGIISNSSSGQLRLTYSTSGAAPNASNSALTVASNGNIGIKTTSELNGHLTFPQNGIITVSDNSSLSILSSKSETSGSSIVLFGNDQSGHLDISAGTLGSLRMYTNDTLHLSVSSSGTTRILTTQNSSNSTSGALIVSGGISISNTENATSYTRGNGLTIAGGGAIAKDLYVGGNITVGGTITASGAVASPTITFSNTDNCSVTGQGNSKLLAINNELVLSFYIEVTPINASQNCQLEFNLPSRTTNLTNRGDSIIQCSGWTDDTNLTPLFNVLSTGVPSSTRAIVKFQSVSTSVHIIQVIARYTSI
jgi:hypothetical protein